jgi:hypothetical protein
MKSDASFCCQACRCTASCDCSCCCWLTGQPFTLGDLMAYLASPGF